VLPKDLEDIFKEYPEDYIDFYIVKADYSGDDLVIEFILKLRSIQGEDPISQKWTIIASSPRKDKVSFNAAPFIEIKNDHPLLWEFRDTQCKLYFTGQCQNIEKLFYDLYLAHNDIFGKHQCSFDISLFKASNNFKPFQYSNGLLARGPKKLMEKYAACLKKNGLNFSFLDETPPGHWYGQQFIPEKELKILLMGDTYLIAEDFVFVKQPEDDTKTD